MSRRVAEEAVKPDMRRPQLPLKHPRTSIYGRLPYRRLKRAKINHVKTSWEALPEARCSASSCLVAIARPGSRRLEELANLVHKLCLIARRCCEQNKAGFLPRPRFLPPHSDISCSPALDIMRGELCIGSASVLSYVRLLFPLYLR